MGVGREMEVLEETRNAGWVSVMAGFEGERFVRIDALGLSLGVGGAARVVDEGLPGWKGA